jgi:hypothetical protein
LTGRVSISYQTGDKVVVVVSLDYIMNMDEILDIIDDMIDGTSPIDLYYIKELIKENLYDN